MNNSADKSVTLPDEASLDTEVPSFLFRIHALNHEDDQTSVLHHRKEEAKCFGIIWMMRGEAELWLDDNRFSVRDDVVYVISPGLCHHLTASPGAKGYSVLFRPDFILSGSAPSTELLWFEDAQYSPDVLMLSLNGMSRKDMEAVIRQMHKEYLHHALSRPLIVKYLLRLFILYFPGNGEGKFGLRNRETDIVKKFLMLLKKQFSTRKKVSEYAGSLHITPGYLNSVVRKISGYTARHLIQEKIIREARRKILHTDASLKEIAAELGFDDPAHFSRYFKNKSGQSFTNYRRQSLEETTKGSR